MPDESDLARALADASAPNTLDPKRIIARSRARRLPRQLATGAASTLAVVGIVVLGVQVAQLPQQSAIMGTTMESDGGADAPVEAFDQTLEEIKRAPADRVNLCEGAMADVAPSAYGLRLDAVFPATALSGTAPVEGAVTLTNTSDRQVVGSTASSPSLTLSRDGIVVWHSNGPTDLSAVIVDLAPGASIEYRASFTPVVCTVADDLAEGFPPGLPPAPAGTYELSALIDFSADPSIATSENPELDLVSGPRSVIELQ
jgi:hypothetical protein